MPGLRVFGQHLLPIHSERQPDFDNFVAGANLSVVESLKLFIQRPAGRGILIHSSSGLGKTHLLLAAQLVLQRKNRVVYLDAARLGLPDAEEDRFEADWLLIDNLQLTVGRSAAERMLVECFELSNQLICTSDQPVEALAFDLADLNSRLQLLAQYALTSPDEQTLLQILDERAAARNIRLPAQIGRYLLSRLSRTPGVLVAVYDLLERTALERKQKLTLSLAAEVVQQANSRNSEGFFLV